jgi:Cu/Ag efflux pump CusA
MLERLAEKSRKIKYAIAVALAALAFVAWPKLDIKKFDLVPDFTPVIVEVQSEARGLAPAEVEALITAPLEEILSGVPWLTSMSSHSVEGLSAVTLQFEEGTNLLRARQMVQERLLHTSILPKVAKPPTMLQPSSSLNRAATIGLTSETMSLIDVSLLARWKLKPRLMSVPGVANVMIYGQRERQLQVEVNNDLLRQKRIQLQDIIRAAGDSLWVSPLTYLRASTPGNGGFIDTPSQRYDIRHVLPISTPADLAKVVFQAGDGSQVTLGDVTKVVEGHQPLIGDGVVNDKPGLMLVVEKLPGASTVDVTQRLEAVLAGLGPALAGVKVVQNIYRPASLLEAASAAIGKWLAATILAAGIVIAVVTRRPGAVTAGVLSVCASLFISAFVLVLLKQQLNGMMAAGMIAALIIALDDVAMMVSPSRQSGAPGSSHFSYTPYVALGAGLALMCLPVLFFNGAAGALLRPAALAFVVTMACSSLIVHCVTPAVLALFPSGGSASSLPSEKREFGSLPNGNGRKVFGLLGLAAIAGLALAAFNPGALIPDLRERDVWVRLNMPAGTSYPAMSKIVTEASQKLRAIQGVREVGSEIGRAIQSDRHSRVDTAEFWIGLNDSASYEESLALIDKALGSYPGARAYPQSYMKSELESALASHPDNLTVRVFGPRWKELQEKAIEVRDVLKGVAGLANLAIPESTQSANLKIQVDLAKARNLGIKPGDIRRGVATLIAGIEVGSLYEEQRIFEVIVWGSNAVRNDQKSLGDLIIDSPTGRKVRLGDVAEVLEVQNPTDIQRTNASRYVDINANVTGARQNVENEVNARLASLGFPLEYHAEIVKTNAQAKPGLPIVLAEALAALAAVFILEVALGGWLATGLALATAIVAVGASALVCYFAGGLSFGSWLGLAAVFALGGRQGLRAVLFTQDGVPAHVRADYVSATLITLASVTAMIFFAFIFGDGGLNVLQPMAVALAAGTVVTALLSLYVLPSLKAAANSPTDSAATSPAGAFVT